MTTVRMVNSVGDHVAGEEYDLEPEVADHYIIMGYATGKTSRAFTSEEIEEHKAPHQTVSVT